MHFLASKSIEAWATFDRNEHPRFPVKPQLGFHITVTARRRFKAMAVTFSALQCRSNNSSAI
jgi:hypothetical protein